MLRCQFGSIEDAALKKAAHLKAEKSLKSKESSLNPQEEETIAESRFGFGKQRKPLKLTISSM